jgi:hypothetical protein
MEIANRKDLSVISISKGLETARCRFRRQQMVFYVRSSNASLASMDDTTGITHDLACQSF